MIVEFFQDWLEYISETFLSKRYTQIDRLKGDYTDKVGALATVITRYPKWCSWMHDTEEKYISDFGIIWYGEHSGRAYVLGLNQDLSKHYKQVEFQKKFIPQLCDRCKNEIVH